jgi:intracellular septation protein
VKQALLQLGQDFLSAIFFFALYGLTHNLYIGVGAGMAVGLAQVARRKLTGRKTDPMQWMSLGLVIVLGGATLLFHTPRFMMLKPTIAHLAVAAVMLRRGWMTRYLPPIAQQYLDQRTIDAAGYGWVVLQVALAVANVILALEVSVAVWGFCVSFGNIASTLTALGLQYLVFRAIITRRIRARVVAVPAADAAGLVSD